MGGDYSRKSFKPRNNYAGVLMQQGRVLLDSDWNQQVELSVRRLRAESIDTMGPATTPSDPDTGFEISVENSKVKIGPGRMYVHGLLAENHGPSEGDFQFDNVLEESRVKESVAIDAQPYLPGSDSPDLSVPNLVYLDVWQREITHLKAPEIVDSAVGVDTTTRLQTVWQVRFLKDTELAETPLLDLLDERHPPADGQLSTYRAETSDSSDPCLLEPGGGYSGLENRLYRIEIHDEGGAGEASFKFSRDNASLGARIIEFNDSRTITVLDTGRDEVSSFASGDWVEITDDNREFAHQVGIMARVKDVDATAKTITFEKDIESLDVDRHARVLRWDQRGKIRYASDGDGGTGAVLVDLDSQDETTGVIPVKELDKKIHLGDGVAVAFHLSNSDEGVFRPGDYWLFAARTKERKLEELENAPPRGVHHHFTELAQIKGGVVTQDYRTKWPPSIQGGCCSAVVSPGEDIQKAIDALPPQGGCICLKSGEHSISEPLTITASHVHIHGEHPGTHLVRRHGTSVFWIEPTQAGLLEHISISNLKIEARAEQLDNQNPALIRLENTTGFMMDNCSLLQESSTNLAVTGLSIRDCQDVSIRSCRFKYLLMGIVASNATGRLMITGNAFAQPVESAGETTPAILLDQMHASCLIENNHFDGFHRSIFAEGTGEDTCIDNNHIRSSTSGGNTPSGDDRIWAIAASLPEVRICRNEVDLHQPTHGGIAVYQSGAWLQSNHIISNDQSGQTDSIPVGIMVGNPFQFGKISADRGFVKHNRFQGVQLAIQCIGADTIGIEGVAIENNVIDYSGSLQTDIVTGIMLREGVNCRISQNLISGGGTALNLEMGRDNSLSDNHIKGVRMGLHAVSETSLAVNQCKFSDILTSGISCRDFRESLRLCNCELEHCGHDDTENMGTSILIRSGDGTAVVDGCRINDTGHLSSGDRTVKRAIDLLMGNVDYCQILNSDFTRTLKDRTDFEVEDRAIILFASKSDSDSSGSLAAGCAQICSNKILGQGRSALIDLFPLDLLGDDALLHHYGTVILSNNCCYHEADPGNDEAGTVLLSGLRLAITGNQVAGTCPVSLRSADWLQNGGKATVTGNIVSGKIILPANTVPQPLDDYNIIG